MVLAACGSLEMHKLWLEKWSAVQQLWLEKWSASDCCPGLQDKNGRTVAMLLAQYGSEEVQKLWLEKRLLSWAAGQEW